MIRKPSLTADKYAAIDELVRLGSIAVNDAQNESRRLGVPNVYSINGRIYYETPTGELSVLDPSAATTEQSDAPESASRGVSTMEEQPRGPRDRRRSDPK